MPSPAIHPRDPLHGITLENILHQLVAKHGWLKMGRRIPIRCLQVNPTVKSSLNFLRKTPWARQQVEEWFLYELRMQKAAAPVKPVEPPPTPPPDTTPPNPEDFPDKGA